jgi:AmmeMemoRadiSam system protein B
MQPKLRPLEIIPIEHQDEEMWLLRDRQGFSSDAALPRVFGPLLALFDGTRDVERIIRDYQLRGGEELPVEFVNNFIAQLDEALLLDSPHFAQHQRERMSEWNDNSSRPAAFAGLSYPDDPEDLRHLLNGFFLEARTLHRSTLPEGAKLRGIVVPHIDFGRGGVVEALAYRPLLKEHFDTFVVLGIAHSGVHYPFCATAKDYETPYGPCRTDREFLRELQERVGPRLKAEQWAHKNEHSVEFVAVFLQHLQHLQNAEIVPIICGGFFNEIQSGRSPATNLAIAEFAQALRDVVEMWEARGKRVGFIASVDLSHVGTQFGDATPLTERRLQQIETEDRIFLNCIEAGDKDALHEAIAHDNNARNVDAHPAVWTLLAAFPELRGQLLHYAQAHNAHENIVVSFASMALYEPAA